MLKKMEIYFIDQYENYKNNKEKIQCIEIVRNQIPK